MSRLRQIILVVRDFESSVALACKELNTFVTFRDPHVSKFGVQNALMPIGDSFLEILSPTVEDNATVRYLNKFGEGGYMVVLQTKDVNELQQIESRLNDNNFRIVVRDSVTIDGQDKTYGVGPGFDNDSEGYAGMHLHPRDVGFGVEILNNTPSKSYAAAGKNWENQHEQFVIQKSGNIGFAAVVIAVDDPEKRCKIWMKLLDVNENNVDYENNIIILNDGSKIKFVQRKNKSENGIVGIEISNKNTKYYHTKKICGVLFTFSPFIASKL